MIVDSSPVKNKVPEQLKDIGKKESLSLQEVYIRNYHSVMLESFTGKGKIAEPSIQCNFEGVRSPNVPVVIEVFKYEEDEEEIFKKLNVPWLPETTSSFQ